MTHLSLHIDPILGTWLTEAFGWLETAIDTRVALLFRAIETDQLGSPDYRQALIQQRAERPPPDLPPGLLRPASSTLDGPDRGIFILTSAAHLAPESLDGLQITNPDTGRVYTEFGGITGRSPGFWPTATTAAFLFGDHTLTQNLDLRARCGVNGPLVQCGLLAPPPPEDSNGALSEAPLRLNTGHAAFTSGVPVRQAPIGVDRFSTALDWDDLVLPPAPAAQVDQIIGWMIHRKTLADDWGFSARSHFGHRALFYGPPGTGKSLTAALIGKVTGLEVYRINLAAVVSKWVGETEKALEGIFAQTDPDHAILFFDEADALLGKRGAVQNAQDRFANLEVSYLLQRFEQFEGLIVLATNFRSNLDSAFTRRFQSVIHFPPPGPAERLVLWQKALSPPVRLCEKTDLEALAGMAPLTGAGIENATQAAALSALVSGDNLLRAHHLHAAISQEAAKEGHLLPHQGGRPE